MHKELFAIKQQFEQIDFKELEKAQVYSKILTKFIEAFKEFIKRHDLTEQDLQKMYEIMSVVREKVADDDNPIGVYFVFSKQKIEQQLDALTKQMDFKLAKLIDAKVNLKRNISPPTVFTTGKMSSKDRTANYVELPPQPVTSADISLEERQRGRERTRIQTASPTPTDKKKFKH